MYYVCVCACVYVGMCGFICRCVCVCVCVGGACMYGIMCDVMYLCIYLFIIFSNRVQANTVPSSMSGEEVDDAANDENHQSDVIGDEP